MGSGTRLRLDTPANRAALEQLFENLGQTDYSIQSPVDPKYNCIGWAAGDDERWWDVSPNGYWPDGVRRSAELAALVEAFESVGFEVVDEEDLRDYEERVALWADDGRWKHAAKWSHDDYWWSKLGQVFDIHHKLHAVSGSTYGQVAAFMARSPVSAQ